MRRAQARGLRVTGSELVGLVPKKVLIDAEVLLFKKARTFYRYFRARNHKNCNKNTWTR